MEDVKLLPCPFCGGEAILHKSREWFGMYSVYCVRCGATVGDEGRPSWYGGTTREEAIALWNRRDGCGKIEPSEREA